MKRTEKELRRIAEHVVTLFPEEEADCNRVCELVMQLKRWEIDGETTNPGEIATLSILRPK